MKDGTRWVVAIIAAIAILGLVLFARGAAERDLPDATPIAIVIDRVA